MTLVNLSAVETILGGYGPIDTGSVSATYWAGRRPYKTVVDDEVRFPSEILVKITDGETLPLEMLPTRGVCCVRWLIRDLRSGMSLLRYTEIPDVGTVDFGDLTVVDPATFAPVDPTPTLLDTIDRQVEAYMVEHPAGGVQATVDPADAGVLLLDYPDFLTDPDDDLILVLPIGA